MFNRFYIAGQNGKRNSESTFQVKVIHNVNMQSKLLKKKKPQKYVNFHGSREANKCMNQFCNAKVTLSECYCHRKKYTNVKKNERQENRKDA